MKLIDSVASELGVNKWDVAILLQHYKYFPPSDVIQISYFCPIVYFSLSFFFFSQYVSVRRWDVNKLHAQYWDQQKKVLKEAGIKKKKKKKKNKQDKNAMVECLICADDVRSPILF